MDPIQSVQAPQNPYNLVGDTSMQQQQIQMPPMQQVAPQIQPTAPVKSEGFFEKFVKGIIRTIAKASGNPDPFTGQPNVVASPTVQTPATPEKGFFGSIGGALTGIAQTAQGVAGGVVSGVENVGGKVVGGVQNVGTAAMSGVQQVGATVRPEGSALGVQSGVSQIAPTPTPMPTPEPVMVQPVVTPQGPMAGTMPPQA